MTLYCDPNYGLRSAPESHTEHLQSHCPAVTFPLFLLLLRPIQ